MERCIKTKYNEWVNIEKPIKVLYIKSKEFGFLTCIHLYTGSYIYNINLYNYIPEVWYDINDRNKYENERKDKIITYKIDLKNTYNIKSIRIVNESQINNNIIKIEYDENTLDEICREKIPRTGFNFILEEEIEEDINIEIENKVTKVNELKIKKVYEGYSARRRPIYMYKIEDNNSFREAEYYIINYKKSIIGSTMYDVNVSLMWDNLE